MISCVVLTKNEEKNIVDCLESVQFCDEIIVIDDYSKDNTISLIRRISQIGKKIKIYQRHLSGNFAGQRNFGMEEAKGDWILFVDADERISSELKEEILKQVQDDDNKYDGFYIKRKDFVFGKWLRFGEVRDIRFIRLIRNGKGLWERSVHERLETLGALGTLKEPILHYPHQTITEFLQKINFYMDLNAKEFFKEGADMVPPLRCEAKVIIYPLAKFIKNYFLLLGFLDGNAGFLHAVFMSLHSFLTRVKIWELMTD